MKHVNSNTLFSSFSIQLIKYFVFRGECYRSFGFLSKHLDIWEGKINLKQIKGKCSNESAEMDKL